MEKFDIIILGAGSGGLNVAGFMNRIGLSVLLVDKSDETIGGDCLNFGCVPSKALIHVSRLVRDGKLAERFGVTQAGDVDLGAVMEYVKGRQEVFRKHENAGYFSKKGMTVVLGEATFVDRKTVEVSGQRYSAKRIIVATGSRPRTIDIPGSEHISVYTNETIFGAKHLPRNLVVLGGGPIGFEIGQAFGRLGSKVTIVNRDDCWLGKEDRSAVLPLVEKMKEEGILFVADVEISKITEDKKAVLGHSDGVETEIPCDALFVGIGRVLNVENLKLENAGIKTDKRGRLVLDKYLRTTNKNVFAVGDVAGQHQFTHAAEVHASNVISNLFKPRLFWKKLNTDGMAWVTYTDPEIATFGLSEEALKSRGEKYQVIEQSFEDNDRSITDERTEGFMRLYIGGKGMLRGGTLVGENAGELVGELILAQTKGLTLGDLFSRVYPYPTASRINKLAAAKYMSGRLTERAKWLLRGLYKNS